MKKIMILFFLIWPLWSYSQDLKKNEFSISLGYLFEGEAYAAEPNAYYSVGETILIHGEFNHYLDNNFGVGIYYTLGFPYYSYIYEEVTMNEIGMDFKARFKASEKLQIKPGVYVGYRMYGGGNDVGVEPGTGLGLNASATFQYQLNEKLNPFFDLGILTQPAGGNDSTDITFSPTFQFSVGVTF